MVLKENQSDIEVKKKLLQAVELPQIEDAIFELYQKLAKEKVIREKILLLMQDIWLPDERKHVSITRSDEGLSIEIQLPDVGFIQEKIRVLNSHSTYKVITWDDTEENHRVFSKVPVLREAYYKILFPAEAFEFIEDEKAETWCHSHLLYAKHRETGYLIRLDLWTREINED